MTVFPLVRWLRGTVGGASYSDPEELVKAFTNGPGRLPQELSESTEQERQ